MAKSKLSIAIVPPLDEEDGDDMVSEDEGTESENGERESFDEFFDALEAGDRDAAYEAMCGFVEQCCIRCMGEDLTGGSEEDEEL